MPTEPQIRLALRDIYDPELHLNLLDLGAVDHITLTPDPEAPGSGIPGVPPRFRVTVTLLTRSDEIDPVLRALTHNRLTAFETLSHIQILTTETPWTQANLTPKGRQTLHLAPPAFPILR